MLELLACSLTVAAGLHLWFRTSLLAEYATLFRLDGWLGLAECAAAMQENEQLTLVGFLAGKLAQRGKTLAFVGRGMACPNCFGLWLAAIACLGAGVWWLTPACYAGGLLVFHRLAPHG